MALCASILAAFAFPRAAQAQVLWHGIKAHETLTGVSKIFSKAQFIKRSVKSPLNDKIINYTEFSFEPYKIGKCEFSVNFDFDNWTSLNGIKLEIYNESRKSPYCFNDIKDGLTQKYGKPTYVSYNTAVSQIYWDRPNGVRVSYTWLSKGGIVSDWYGWIGYYPIPNSELKNSL